MRPLADEIRPQTLDDVAGQKHLLGEGALLRRLLELKPDFARARFKLAETALNEEGEALPLSDPSLADEALLEAACKGRGWLLSGGRFDLERGAALVLDEFRAGKVGKISLESPEV